MPETDCPIFSSLCFVAYRISIASQLHISNLLPCPIMIQLGRFDKCKMDSKTAMNSGAINANEHSIGRASPCWIFATTIKTKLKYNDRWRGLKYSKFEKIFFSLTLFAGIELRRLNTWAISALVGFSIFTIKILTRVCNEMKNKRMAFKASQVWKSDKLELRRQHLSWVKLNHYSKVRVT